MMHFQCLTDPQSQNSSTPPGPPYFLTTAHGMLLRPPGQPLLQRTSLIHLNY